jgi:DNA primase
MRQPLEVDGRELSVSNLDKVLYPATGFRKGEYSLRATWVPLVSAPLDWSELAAPSPVTPAQVLERIAARGDLFAEALTLRQSLPCSNLRHPPS